ncbi:hypothetical protein GGS21DRAFT_487158 [Xylaria nigripes]|nr:hypothetical protein GGS21DRAFT_487158 [Xylaria nigripes]
MPDPSVCFSLNRLPVEIRRLIWANALPRGRIQLFARDAPWKDWRLGPPLIACVCRESRRVALDLSLVRDFPTAQDSYNETWFIASRDILELASGYPYHLSNPEPFFAAAEALAIPTGDFGGDIKTIIGDMIRGIRFPSVKVVYLIADQISTVYWSRFRPDLTSQDKDKGTILDLSDSDDLKSIDEYEAWARSQEMSPVFPTREEVEIPLQAAIDEIVVNELNAYHQSLTSETRSTFMGSPITPGTSPSGQFISRYDPWVQQQWKRLPEFRPAVLVLGWR